MCGRYSFFAREDFEKKHSIKGGLWERYLGSYNIAPTQTAPVIKEDGEAAMMPWAFTLSFLNKPLINIRDDSLHKGWAKKYISFQRCAIPFSYFYEWKKLPEGKQPYAIGIKGSKLNYFAGVYNDDGYSIITTTPNDLMAPIHNRMPVILKDEEVKEYLNPDMTELDEIKSYILPYPSQFMETFPISTRVNSPMNNDKSLLQSSS